MGRKGLSTNLEKISYKETIEGPDLLTKVDGNICKEQERLG